MGDRDEEILIETRRIGTVMEVRAVSASDGLEIAFEAPSNAPLIELQRLAQLKLAYVRSRSTGKESPGDPGKAARPGKGLLA